MKKIKYLLLVIAFIFLTTGCVEFKSTMEIKKDKSMDFSIRYALDTSYFGNEANIKPEEKKKMEKQGFTVKDYKKDKMKGVELTKTVKNIDDVSSTKATQYSLSGVVSVKNKSDKLFKVEKGFFKNHYIAKYDFNMGDSSASNGSNMSSYLSNMDLSFDVKVPYKALKNNASKVSKDKKTLKWDLTDSKIKSIEFEFELYNTTNIIICVVSGIVIIGAIVVIIVALTKRIKKNQKRKLQRKRKQIKRSKQL